MEEKIFGEEDFLEGHKIIGMFGTNERGELFGTHRSRWRLADCVLWTKVRNMVGRLRKQRYWIQKVTQAQDCLYK